MDDVDGRGWKIARSAMIMLDPGWVAKAGCLGSYPLLQQKCNHRRAKYSPIIVYTSDDVIPKSLCRHLCVQIPCNSPHFRVLLVGETLSIE